MNHQLRRFTLNTPISRFLNTTPLSHPFFSCNRFGCNKNIELQEIDTELHPLNIKILFETLESKGIYQDIATIILGYTELLTKRGGSAVSKVINFIKKSKCECDLIMSLHLHLSNKSDWLIPVSIDTNKHKFTITDTKETFNINPLQYELATFINTLKIKSISLPCVIYGLLGYNTSKIIFYKGLKQNYDNNRDLVDYQQIEQKYNQNMNDLKEKL